MYPTQYCMHANFWSTQHLHIQILQGTTLASWRFAGPASRTQGGYGRCMSCLPSKDIEHFDIEKNAMYRKLTDVSWIVTRNWYPGVRLLNRILVLVLNRISTGRLCYIFPQFGDSFSVFKIWPIHPTCNNVDLSSFIMIHHGLSIQPVFVTKSNFDW